mmetsp:Transcript_13416/g.58638  ORF Transcript_13416/g.58638 Transcript_13416/m.58638 type:complete len:575 (+) Transcript_13416:5281-7005(+)
MTPTAMSGGSASIIAAAPAASSDAMYGTIAATNGVSRLPLPADASSTWRTSSPDIPSRHAAAALGSSLPSTAAASEALMVDAHIDPSAVAGWIPFNTSGGQHLNRFARDASESRARPVPLFAVATTRDIARDASSGFIAPSAAHAALGFSLQSSASASACSSGDKPAISAAHSSPVKSPKIAPAVPSGHASSIRAAALFCAALGIARRRFDAALPSCTSALSVPAICDGSASFSESASLAGGTDASAGASCFARSAAASRVFCLSAAGRRLSSSYAAPRPSVRPASSFAPIADRTSPLRASSIAPMAAAASSAPIAPTSRTLSSGDMDASASATAAGGILLITAATPSADPASAEAAAMARSAAADSSSDIRPRADAKTSALAAVSSGDVAAMSSAPSAGAIAPSTSATFSSDMAPTAAAAAAAGIPDSTCAVADGNIPFIILAAAAPLCPASASAACSGGSDASAWDDASGVIFTRMALISPTLMFSSSRISGRAASASTVNGEPTTASCSRDTDTVCRPGWVHRYVPKYCPRSKRRSTAEMPPEGVRTRTLRDSFPDMRLLADSYAMGNTRI